MPENLLKPWSISTAVRNPDRLRGFLAVLTQLDGKKWNHATQISFQIKLIQERQYGFGNPQFYRGLSDDDIKLIESNKKISHKRASEIFIKKQYEDPAMRGRNSFKPLEKFGFALIVGGEVRITESGRALLFKKSNYSEIFMRALLKWQIPNPLERSFPKKYGYNIKPFVGVLHLIKEVNELCKQSHIKPVGLSRLEFNFFGLTLIDWRKIKTTAKEIDDLRKQLAKVPRVKQHSFINRKMKELRGNFNLEHLRDYGDNALRYFRMTKYIRLRGFDTHIDLEPMRQNELRSLFKNDDARPRGLAVRNTLPLDGVEVSYPQFLASVNEPTLPGENKDELTNTVRFLHTKLQKIVKKTPLKVASTTAGLKKQRDKLRISLQSNLRQSEKRQIQQPEQAETCIKNLRSLLGKKQERQQLSPSLNLEQLTTLGLDLMNDAEKIHPNYPLDDNGKPINTAPAYKPDIECFYKTFAAICEVTMLRSRQQWMQEAQPVMRHLHEFGKTINDKPTYCLFIAPTLHQDSLNTFRFNIREGYEGEKQRIVPLTLENFCEILEFFKERVKEGNPVKSDSIKSLFDAVSVSLGNMRKSDDWRNKQLPQVIEQWKQST